ncbi:MAG: tetratricopeptide repeat protein [Deltaproteobacteria bacterium]|nr:tetratricopeptide repeat protein [Deltaproteobacteria bacterium]
MSVLRWSGLPRWVGVAALLLGLAAPVPARAEVGPKVEQLNAKAMESYDGLEFDEAKTQLLAALKAAQEGGLTAGKALVSTYLNLGIVYGAGLNDRLTAIRYFTEAIKLDREVKLDPKRATPALDEMFNSAKDAAGPAPAPATADFKHVPVSQAREGQSLSITASVGGSLKARRVVLFVRRSGRAEFSSQVMEAIGGETYRGLIPPALVQGRSLHYYLEAQDGSGERLAGSGTAASPNTVAVGAGDRDLPRPPRKREKLVSIAVGIGTGLGVVFGGSSEHLHPRRGGKFEAAEVTPGGAMSPLHLMGELGIHLTRHWHLAGLVRVQLVNGLSGDTVTEPNTVSVLGMARAKRFFGDGSTRFYLSFGAGGGQIRHRISLGDYDRDPTTPDDIVDARVAGVGLFGFGGGLNVMFTPTVGMMVDLNGMLMIPDFAAHVDLSAGLVLSF